MSIKNNLKNKAKKVVIKALKPFLPFILIISLLFFAICTIIDAIFIQEVQSDSSSMPPAQLEIKNKCIKMSEYLNTSNNFIGTQSTNYLLDVDNKENNKQIEWSHLYSLLVFHNIANAEEINEKLLNEIANNFKSSFIYEQTTIKTDTITKDNNGNEVITTKEENIYILVESNTIIGHYKYNYKEQIIEKDNIKTTRKVFTNEELIGEKYERLKIYLKDKLHIKDDNLETDLQIIIEAANGYYEGEESTSWLQTSNPSNIIIDGKGLVPTRYVCMAYTWIYKNNISFWNENTSNYSACINYIVVLMCGAPIRC